MNIAGVVARLKTNAVPPLKTVGGAGDVNAAIAQARGVVAGPTAYVLRTADDGEPNKLATMAVHQRVTTIFGVLIGARELSDPKGGAGIDALDAARDAIRAALLGWVPESGDDPVEFVRGRRVLLADSVSWWLDEWRTRSHIRATA